MDLDEGLDTVSEVGGDKIDATQLLSSPMSTREVLSSFLGAVVDVFSHAFGAQSASTNTRDSCMLHDCQDVYGLLQNSIGSSIVAHAHLTLYILQNLSNVLGIEICTPKCEACTIPILNLFIHSLNQPFPYGLALLKIAKLYDQKYRRMFSPKEN